MFWWSCIYRWRYIFKLQQFYGHFSGHMCNKHRNCINLKYTDILASTERRVFLWLLWVVMLYIGCYRKYSICFIMSLTTSTCMLLGELPMQVSWCWKWQAWNMLWILIMLISQTKERGKKFAIALPFDFKPDE